MRKTFKMSALVAGLAAAGGVGYVAQPPMSDEELVEKMVERAGNESFRKDVAVFMEKNAAERRELLEIIEEEVKHETNRIRTRMAKMEPFAVRARIFQEFGEEAVISDPIGECFHCEEPSVRWRNSAPVHLRRCVGCDRRWTMLGTPMGGGAWMQNEHFPSYIDSMKAE